MSLCISKKYPGPACRSLIHMPIPQMLRGLEHPDPLLMSTIPCHTHLRVYANRNEVLQLASAWHGPAGFPHLGLKQLTPACRLPIKSESPLLVAAWGAPAGAQMPPMQPSAALLQGARVQSPRTPQHVRPLHLQQPIGARAHAGSPQAWPVQNVSVLEMRRPQV